MKKSKISRFFTPFTQALDINTPSILVKALSRVIPPFFFNHIYVHTKKKNLLKFYSYIMKKDKE